MTDVLQYVEQLPLERCLPIVPLCEFRGGNQLPIWEVAGKDFVIQKSRLLEAVLVDMWSKGEPRDLVLKVGAKKIFVNRLRFLCYSKYAMENVKGGQRELVLPEDKVTVAGVKRVFEWMVREPAVVEREGVIEMLIASIFLEVDALVKQVWYLLDIGTEFTEDHAFAVAHDARRLREFLPTLFTLVPIVGLETSMLHRIQRFFLLLVASREFLEMPLKQLLCLLDSEQVAVNSEKEIFYSVVRWLSHDWEARSDSMPALIGLVRLVLLPREFLLSLENEVGDPNVDHLIQLKKFKAIIYEAYSSHILTVFNDGSIIFEQLFEIFNLRMPKVRPFIYHEKCPHHRPRPDDEEVDFSYKDFQNYLRQLQEGEPENWKSLKVEMNPPPSIFTVAALLKEPTDSNNFIKNLKQT